MKHRLRKRIFAALGTLCLTAAVARATDEHTYGPHEYATIWHGKSPNHHFSIATHGTGEGGFENFHPYLMAEPGHKSIGPLEEVSDVEDTGPMSFEAVWSPDSQYVAILYREDRHVLAMDFYRIAKRRAYHIDDSSLLDNFIGDRHYKMPSDSDVLMTVMEVHWTNAHHFLLSEEDYIATGADLSLANLARPFSTVRNESQDKKRDYYVHFSATALCAIGGSDADGYKLVSVSPRKPTYNFTLPPNLHYSSHRSLYNDFTSLQSR